MFVFQMWKQRITLGLKGTFLWSFEKKGFCFEGRFCCFIQKHRALRLCRSPLQRSSPMAPLGVREESSLRKNAPQDKHVEHAEGWVKCKIHIQGGRCALVFWGSVGGMFLWVLVGCVVHCVGVGWNSACTS